MTDDIISSPVGEQRLTAILRAAHADASPQDPVSRGTPSRSGMRDPLIRRTVRDLYLRSLDEGYLADWEAFLILIGRALADLHPDGTEGPALTLANLAIIEHVLFERPYRPARKRGHA